MVLGKFWEIHPRQPGWHRAGGPSSLTSRAVLAAAGVFGNMEEEIPFYFAWNPLSVFDKRGHNVVYTSRGTNI